MMEGLKHMDGLSQMLMAIFFVIMTYRATTQPSKPQNVLWFAGTMVFAPIVDMTVNKGSFHSLWGAPGDDPHGRVRVRALGRAVEEDGPRRDHATGGHLYPALFGLLGLMLGFTLNPRWLGSDPTVRNVSKATAVSA
ncbi:MAG TPA: hypothetical protein VGL40_00060 [Bacillota bacterium]|jgi:hypothetical protein